MRRHLFLIAAALATFAASLATAHSNPGMPDDRYAQTRIVRCQSPQGRRTFCPVPNVAQARVSRQLSRSGCIRGRTWNYSNRGLWVSGGCRADFAVTLARGYQSPNAVVRDDHYVDSDGRLIHCESTASGRTYCGDGHSRYSMAGNRDPDCIEGRTWGSDSRGVWVSGDCDAQFSATPYEGGYGYENSGAVSGAEEVEHTHTVDEYGQVIHCQSTADGRTYCGERDSRYVMSGSPDPDCVEGETYGYDSRGIWVSGDCDAQFRLQDDDGDDHTHY